MNTKPVILDSTPKNNVNDNMYVVLTCWTHLEIFDELKVKVDSLWHNRSEADNRRAEIIRVCHGEKDPFVRITAVKPDTLIKFNDWLEIYDSEDLEKRHGIEKISTFTSRQTPENGGIFIPTSIE